MGSAKPCATVVIQGEGEAEERLQIPAAVGKLLSSKQKTGEIHPSSRGELCDIIAGLARSCAMTRVERLINRREYARSELVQKLELDGYDHKTIGQCVDYACRIGLVSDKRYADVFVRSKVDAGWGMGRIERELASRGIEVDSLVGWPYEYLDPDDELSRAIGVAERRRVSGANAYQKLVRFLSSRGFTLGVATKAASRVLAEA